MTRYFLGAAFAAMSLISATAAAAQTPSNEDVMVVRLSDLDIGHQAGAKAALQRIQHAAAVFCDDGTSANLERRYEIDRCKSRMTNKAVSSLGSTEVSAIWTKSSPVQSDGLAYMTVASRDPR